MDQSTVRTTVSLETVRYDKSTGLVPVVVQDATSGLVLMVAYANREALKRTHGTGDAWFWSRSRQSYWHKGETSGNVQRVVEIRVDCDGDSVLYLVDPAGPACHTGETTCFYRQMVREADGNVGQVGAAVEAARTPLGSPCVPSEPSAGRDIGSSEIYDGSADSVRMREDEMDDSVLHRLWGVISARWVERPQGSYTTYLFEQGIDKVAKKVGEEATEVVIAAKNALEGEPGQVELASESADLLYHLLALWKVGGISPNDVYAVLGKRL